MNIRPETVAFINELKITPHLHIFFQFIAVLTKMEPRHIILTLLIFFPFPPTVYDLHYYFVKRDRIGARSP